MAIGFGSLWVVNYNSATVWRDRLGRARTCQPTDQPSETGRIAVSGLETLAALCCGAVQRLTGSTVDHLGRT